MDVYGIPNCDTVKKALNFLKANNAAYTFHDFKKEGVSREQLEKWAKQLGWETLLNKRGTTWRKLSPEVQASVHTQADAIRLMQEHSSLIKRPVVEKGNTLSAGFDEALFREKYL
mgnify:CR=1 FL=1